MQKYTRFYVALAVVYTASIVGLVYYIVSLDKKLLETSVLQSASLYSEAVAKFRSVYTTEVVDIVDRHPDFSVTHDYRDRQHSIPLPATLSMMLGKSIGSSLSGAETQLYSAYPFPWRENSEGLNSDFRKEAWQAINSAPGQPYYKFTSYKGKAV